MSLLIAAAVEQELGLLIDRLGAEADPASCHGGLWRAEPAQGTVWLAVVGIGPLNAAFNLGRLAQRLNPKILLMVGSAGALPGSRLEKGQTVVALSETLAELGLVIGAGIADGPELGLPGLDQTIELDRELAVELARASGSGSGPLLTVAGVSADINQASRRVWRFQSLAESMEGYALALAGQRLGLPAAEVRGISNQAGDRDKAEWDLAGASRAAQKAVLAWLGV